MKFSLPLSLRRYVLFLGAIGVTCSDFVHAGYMHSGASIITYTDFGQNCGRYAVGNTNALLDYINKDGVKLTYTGGQADYTMLHGMIDYSSQCDGGYGAAIGYNFCATVQHNGVLDCTYAGNSIGGSNAIHYQGIEYRYSGKFLLTPSNDYKITRQSKLVTDVTGSTVYGSTTGDYSGLTDGSLQGQILYRAGSGTMGVFDANGNSRHLCGAYTYITGGMQKIDALRVTNWSDMAISTDQTMSTAPSYLNAQSPLPYVIQAGDSGSPAWVWNEDTGQYEYLNAMQSGGDRYSQARGACEWTVNTMESFNKNVAIGADNTVYINEVTTAGDSVSDGTYTAHPYSGTVTGADGTTLVDFVGVKSGINTWKDLSGLKDTNNWYSYGNWYLNASNSMAETANGVLNYADLYMTENLVFTASSSEETQNILMNADVDLGLGYAQFSLGEGQESASFRLVSAEGNNYLLNSAGFVVDKGVTLTVELTNPAEYMREWRKLGEGDLRIAGNGNNDIFLNVGGSGASYGESETYLEREGGYAAYNVLANNGATVVIRDTDQIKRDFTFGYRGGYLDMNGNSMTWNNGNDASADGFTIHALDEGARITNGAEQDVTLTWTQGGDQTWLGSFVDQSGKGALSFIYNGGEGASLTMHSIYTNLANEGSGITVQSGTLALEGTNTVHGMGSQSGTNANRYSSADDWHYADTASDVTVQNGGTFRLGSHARLTGDVTVESGGTFVMNEGVRHQYEYIEGGQVKEDTEAVSAYFGLKGNVNLAEGSAMKVQFSEGTDSTLSYAGNISGEGGVTVDLGDQGKLKLTGNNTFSGEKQLNSGKLIVASNTAFGDTSAEKWVIADKAVMVLGNMGGEMSSTELLNKVDVNSRGVLALTEDRSEQFDMSKHYGLVIGAEEGCSVQYGEVGTTETLQTSSGRWVLGGGGGELVVNFKLSGENSLVLGNEYGKGSVHLANTANDFDGYIIFAGGVTLTYEEGALGNATIDLLYTNRIQLSSAEGISSVSEFSDGAVLLDRMSEGNIDLTNNQSLYLGAQEDASFSGTLTVAEGAAYRFGASSGMLTVDAALASGHDLIVDGQTYDGGGVTLAHAQENFDGQVTVRGYDSDSTDVTDGDITLRFRENDTLIHASRISLEDGGTIDLAGTSQTMNLAGMVAGSSITDSSADKASVLTLNGSEGDVTLSGSLDVGTLIKTGENNLNLGGSNSYKTFEVRGGTVTMQSNTPLAASGEMTLKDGSMLCLNGQEVSGTINLEGNSSVSGQGKIGGTLNVRSGSTGGLNNDGSTWNAIGLLNVEEGASFRANMSDSGLTLIDLHGKGNVDVVSTQNKSGGTAISINGSDKENFGGRLAIDGADNLGTGVAFANYGSFGSGTVALNGVAFWLRAVNNTDTPVAAMLEVGAKGVTIKGSDSTAYYFSGLSGNGVVNSNLQWGTISFGGDMTGFVGSMNSNKAQAGSAYTFLFGRYGVNYHEVIGSDSAEAVNLFGMNEDGSAAVRLNSSQNMATISYNFQYSDDVVANAVIGGKAKLAQWGTGTLVLDQENTYTGETMVFVGTLAVKGSVGSESSGNKFTVHSGSKLALRENGKIANSGVTVQNRNAAQGISLCSAEVDDSEGTLENVTVTTSSMRATDASARGTMENVAVTVTSQSFDIGDIDMHGSTVQASSSLTLTDVSMDADSFVGGAGDTATNAELYNVSLAVVNDAVAADDASVYGAEGAMVYVYTIANFDNVTLGGSIILNFNDLVDRLTTANTIVAIDFGDGVSLKDGFTVTASYDNATYVSNLLTQGNKVLFVSTSESIPEPTTASLVMLGLAAGILRRRRTASAN